MPVEESQRQELKEIQSGEAKWVKMIPGIPKDFFSLQVQRALPHPADLQKRHVLWAKPVHSHVQSGRGKVVSFSKTFLGNRVCTLDRKQLLLPLFVYIHRTLVASLL